MTQININLLLQNFFNRNPDIKKAGNKGLVNRRALAKFIIENEKLDKNKLEALVTAIRRYKSDDESKGSLGIFREIKISTKDKISIVYLEKSEEALKNISKAVNLVDFNKNETLKIVQGSQSIKLFIDEFNVKKIEGIFHKNNILKILKNISELNLLFSEKAKKTKGIISYVTSELTINNLNIIEFLTCTPELIIYVDESELLKAYETINRLKEQ